MRSRLRDAGAGELWAGQIEQSGAECVVRRVRLAPDPVLRSAALAAAQGLTGFSHPHLVPVIMALPTSDGLALITGPVSGAVSLARLLSARGALDPGEVVTVGLPIAQALGAAHAAGIVHGRLAREDILLEPTGRPVLVGLGVAGLADPGRTAPMSPAVATVAAGDVYDLATMLLESMREATGPDAAAVAVALATAMVDDAHRRPSADDVAAALARSATPLPVRLDLPDLPAAVPSGQGSSAPAQTGGPVTETAPSEPPATGRRSARQPSRPVPPDVAQDGDARPRLLGGARLGQGGDGTRGGEGAGRGESGRPGRGATGATAVAAGELLDSLPPPPRRSTPTRRAARASGHGPAAAARDRRAAGGVEESESGPSAGPSATDAGPGRGSAGSAPRPGGSSGSARRPRREGAPKRGWLLPATAGVGLFVAVVAAVLLLTNPSDDGGPARSASPASGRPSASAAAGAAQATSAPAGQPTASPVAGQSPEQVWRGVLGGLNAARSRAFEQGKEVLLADSDVPGSQAYNSDVQLIRTIVGRGAHSSPLRTEILALQVRSSSSGQTLLRVTDRLESYDFLDAGGQVIGHQDAKAPVQRDLVLQHTTVGWRVSQSLNVVN
ncbi:Serine/threonine protein kinase [Frankia sp. AiPs1]